MMEKIVKILLLFIFTFLMITSTKARIFWVSPTGNGTSCIQNNPCAFQYALNEAKSNGEDDIIYLMEGIYYGNFQYYSPDHKSLTISGAPGTKRENVILDGQNNDRVLYLHDWNSGNVATILIKGITIQNGNSTDDGGGIYAALADYIIEIKNCIIKNNQAKDYGGGIYMDTNQNLTLENCIIYNNSVTEGSARGGGVAMLIGGNPRDYIVRNNIIYSNNADKEGGGIFIGWSSETNIYFINNTVYQNQAEEGGGVYFYSANNTYVYNNIIYNNSATDGGDIYFGGAWISRIGHNNDYADIYGSWNEESGNISADPKFIDPTNGDFHLKSDSPCINAGDNNAPHLPDKDFEGDPRVINGIVDIGADEFAQTLAIPTLNWWGIILLLGGTLILALKVLKLQNVKN